MTQINHGAGQRGERPAHDRQIALTAGVRATRDAEFARAWQLYLAGSLAAFTTGCMQLFQVLFARGGNNEMPRSRRRLYE